MSVSRDERASLNNNTLVQLWRSEWYKDHVYETHIILDPYVNL